MRAKRLDGGPLASGSRFEQVRQFGGREQKTTAMVDEVTAPERFTWRSDDGPVKANGGYRLAPTATERRCTWTSRCGRRDSWA